MKLESPIPGDVYDAISAPFREGADHVLDAPVLQPLGLLLDLAGEMLRERLFVVQSTEAAPESCLRTDFTISALTAHLESGRKSGRYFYSGHVFRVAPPGSERAEEFPQVGVEVFEPGDPAAADAEIAAAAWSAARAGGRTDLSLLLGDVSLFGAVVDALGLAPPLAARLKRSAASPRKLRAELEAAVKGERPGRGGGGRLGALLAKLPEPEAVAALQEIWDLAGVEPVASRSAVEIVHRLAERSALAEAPRLSPSQADLFGAYMAISGSPEAALQSVESLVGGKAAALGAARDSWMRRIDAMVKAGVPAEAMRFSTAFGRAFGYYDGAIFEIRSAALGPDQAVGAGGRYDGLAARLGAQIATGAVGAMVRPGRAWRP